MILYNRVDCHSHANQWDKATLDACIASVSVLPGKVAVLCDKHLEATVGGILMPDGKYQGSQDSDTGTVISSGYKYLQVGDRVGFKPMDGLRCDSKEHDWVPVGAEIRFYGVSDGVNESLFQLIA